MHPLDYIQKTLNFVLGDRSLIATDRNPETGYQTTRNIEQTLADSAVEAGNKVGDEIEYIVFIRKKS